MCSANRAGAVGGPVQVRVVQQHDMLVPGQVDVALHAVGAVGNGLQIGGPGVLGKGGTGAAVGVDLGPARGEVVASHADTLAHPAARPGARLGKCR